MVFLSSFVGMLLISGFLRKGGSCYVAGMGVLANLVIVELGVRPMSPVLLNDFIMVDKLSVIMVVMSFLVGMMSLCCSRRELVLNVHPYKEKVEVPVLGVLVSCVVYFMSSGWMMFYICFEASLVPIVWLILSWGVQPERLQAATFIIMYTVCASMPLLACLLWLQGKMGSDNFLLMGLLQEFSSLAKSMPCAMWVGLVFSFLVKFPMYGVHSWLPKAHVEAPLAGSMLLSGVLLKLGGFGLCRVLWLIGTKDILITTMIISCALWGGLVSSCMCLCQSDLKAMVAYSSIGHMGLCLAGIVSMFPVGWNGAAVLMFAHGLCSPVLFALVTSVYDWSGSRSVVLNKGVLRVFPGLMFLWFCHCAVNMGFPPSLNFFGEVMLFCSVKGVSGWFLIVLVLMCFFNGVQCFYMYSCVAHGSKSSYLRGSHFDTERVVYSAVMSLMILGTGFTGLDFFML